MPTFGTIQRQKPRLEVIRGYDPNEPTTFTAAVPVTAGETIISGQLISQVYNNVEDRYEWALGVYFDSDITNEFDIGDVDPQTDNNKLNQVFVALQDSTDEDVLSAGNLVGLSCAGQFELESAFFAPTVSNSAQIYNVDVPITPCGNDQGLTAADGTLKGFFRPTTYKSGEPIIGIVTRNRGLKDLGPQAGANGAILRHQTNSNVIDKEVVSFYTHWNVANDKN